MATQTTKDCDVVDAKIVQCPGSENTLLAPVVSVQQPQQRQTVVRTLQPGQPQPGQRTTIIRAQQPVTVRQTTGQPISQGRSVLEQYRSETLGAPSTRTGSERSVMFRSPITSFEPSGNAAAASGAVIEATVDGQPISLMRPSRRSTSPVEAPVEVELKPFPEESLVPIQPSRRFPERPVRAAELPSARATRAELERPTIQQRTSLAPGARVPPSVVQSVEIEPRPITRTSEVGTRSPRELPLRSEARTLQREAPSAIREVRARNLQRELPQQRALDQRLEQQEEINKLEAIAEDIQEDNAKSLVRPLVSGRIQEREHPFVVTEAIRDESPDVLSLMISMYPEETKQTLRSTTIADEKKYLLPVAARNPNALDTVLRYADDVDIVAFVPDPTYCDRVYGPYFYLVEFLANIQRKNGEVPTKIIDTLRADINKRLRENPDLIYEEGVGDFLSTLGCYTM